MKRLSVLIFHVFILCALCAHLQAQQRIYYDAAAFVLKGNVRTVKVVNESGDILRGIDMAFSREGALTIYSGKPVKESFTNLMRNENGVLMGAVADEGKDSYVWMYDEYGKVLLYGISSTKSREDMMGFNYGYNETGDLIGEKETSGKVTTLYSDIKYDDRGNWTERKVKEIIFGFLEEEWKEYQIITYWDDDEPSTPQQNTPQVTEKPSATIKGTRVIHLDGVPGVHDESICFQMNVTVHNAKGKDITFVSYYTTTEGEPLKDFNQSYCSTDGCVSMYQEDKSDYDHCTWNAMSLIIPDKELHLSTGWHEFNVDGCVFLGDECLGCSEPQTIRAYYNGSYLSNFTVVGGEAQPGYFDE